MHQTGAAHSFLGADARGFRVPCPCSRVPCLVLFVLPLYIYIHTCLVLCVLHLFCLSYRFALAAHSAQVKSHMRSHMQCAICAKMHVLNPCELVYGDNDKDVERLVALLISKASKL